MTQTSYPITGQPIPHAQWRSLFEGRAGIYGQQNGGTGNFQLTLSATNDTATISSGRFDYRGFTLEVSADEGMTLPAATTANITYVIGALYDPTKEGAATGPLSLFVQDKAKLTIPAGDTYQKFYEVVRKPSTVLSQSTVTDFRYYISAPVFWPQSPAGSASGFTGADPNPDDFPYGQLLVQTNPYDIKVRRGGNTPGTGTWSSITSPPWANLSMATGYRTFNGHTPQYRVVGDVLQLRGWVERTNGATFDNLYRTVASVPSTASPFREVYLPCGSNFSSDTGGGGMCNVQASGVVQVNMPYGLVSWVSLDGISIPIGA